VAAAAFLTSIGAAIAAGLAGLVRDQLGNTILLLGGERAVRRCGGNVPFTTDSTGDPDPHVRVNPENLYGPSLSLQ
jgi:hypothetical protein